MSHRKSISPPVGVSIRGCFIHRPALAITSRGTRFTASDQQWEKARGDRPAQHRGYNRDCGGGQSPRMLLHPIFPPVWETPRILPHCSSLQKHHPQQTTPCCSSSHAVDGLKSFPHQLFCLICTMKAPYKPLQVAAGSAAPERLSPRTCQLPAANSSSGVQHRAKQSRVQPKKWAHTSSRHFTATYKLTVDSTSTPGCAFLCCSFSPAKTRIDKTRTA